MTVAFESPLEKLIRKYRNEVRRLDEVINEAGKKEKTLVLSEAKGTKMALEIVIGDLLQIDLDAWIASPEEALR